MGLGRVLDDREPVTRRQGAERVHVGRQAVEVDRDDRPRPRRHSPSGVGGIDVVSLGIHVGEHRCRPLVEHRLGRRDERERRHDDLVSLAHARRREGHVEGGGSAVRRQAEPRPDHRGELGLERLHLRRPRAGEHPAVQDARDRRAVGLRQDRPAPRRHRARGGFLREYAEFGHGF